MLQRTFLFYFITKCDHNSIFIFLTIWRTFGLFLSFSSYKRSDHGCPVLCPFQWTRRGEIQGTGTPGLLNIFSFSLCCETLSKVVALIQTPITKQDAWFLRIHADSRCGQGFASYTLYSTWPGISLRLLWLESASPRMMAEAEQFFMCVWADLTFFVTIWCLFEY